MNKILVNIDLKRKANLSIVIWLLIPKTPVTKKAEIDYESETHVFENDDKPKMEVTENGQTIDQECSKGEKRGLPKHVFGPVHRLNRWFWIIPFRGEIWDGGI